MESRTMARPEVLVRAAGDEPVRLWAVSTGPHSVIVTDKGGSTSVGFPAADVYVFDAVLFQQLQQAYRDSDQLRLSHLWESGNRYTDSEQD
jgi:hypothetical protein